MTKKSRIRPDTFRLMRFSREDVKIADFPIAGIVFTKNLFIINSFVTGHETASGSPPQKNKNSGIASLR